MPTLTITLANDFAALGPASERIRVFLAEAGAPDAAAFLADLVVEELVTNTIKYGYPAAAGPHLIQLALSFEADLLVLEVRDDGHPFDPLEQDAPDTTLPASERPIGGLGIHLVRQMCDSVHYERRGHENVVIATKSFAARH